MTFILCALFLLIMGDRTKDKMNIAFVLLSVCGVEMLMFDSLLSPEQFHLLYCMVSTTVLLLIFKNTTKIKEGFYLFSVAIFKLTELILFVVPNLLSYVPYDWIWFLFELDYGFKLGLVIYCLGKDSVSFNISSLEPRRYFLNVCVIATLVIF